MVRTLMQTMMPESSALEYGDELLLLHEEDIAMRWLTVKKQGRSLLDARETTEARGGDGREERRNVRGVAILLCRQT